MCANWFSCTKTQELFAIMYNKSISCWECRSIVAETGPCWSRSPQQAHGVKSCSWLKLAQRKKKQQKVNLPHLVHCNHTNSWTTTRDISTKGQDGTIAFDSGASLCSLKVSEKTRPLCVLHSRGMATLLFEDDSPTKLKNITLKNRRFFCFTDLVTQSSSSTLGCW